jgi:hypothetical protein
MCEAITKINKKDMRSENRKLCLVTEHLRRKGTEIAKKDKIEIS